MNSAAFGRITNQCMGKKNFGEVGFQKVKTNNIFTLIVEVLQKNVLKNWCSPD
jgi:hypothetical protein